jgi:uncharacterized protein YycO
MEQVPTIPPGPRVLLFRGRGPIGWAIRTQTRTKYSHAALLLPDGKTIIEAWQGSGLFLRNNGVHEKTITDWSDVDAFLVDGMRPEQWDKALDFARQQVGKGYNYRGVARFLTRTSSTEDNGLLFCSQLVFASIAAGGVRLLERIEAEAVAPGHLAWSPFLIPAARPAA